MLYYKSIGILFELPVHTFMKRLNFAAASMNKNYLTSKHISCQESITKSLQLSKDMTQDT